MGASHTLMKSSERRPGGRKAGGEVKGERGGEGGRGGGGLGWRGRWKEIGTLVKLIRQSHTSTESSACGPG